MSRRAAALSVLAGLAAASPAVAQDKPAVTVRSLLAQDFTVVGAIPSNIGAGVFLQKKDRLFLCFVNETPRSTNVATKYCKAVE